MSHGFIDDAVKILDDNKANCSITSIIQNTSSANTANATGTINTLDVLITSVILEVFTPLIPRFPQFQVMSLPCALIVDGLMTVPITAKSAAIDVHVPLDADMELQDVKNELIFALRAIIDPIIAAGDAYIAYVPLMSMVIYDPATFTPTYTFRTRYATYHFKHQ